MTHSLDPAYINGRCVECDEGEPYHTQQCTLGAKWDAYVAATEARKTEAATPGTVADFYGRERGWSMADIHDPRTLFTHPPCEKCGRPLVSIPVGWALVQPGKDYRLDVNLQRPIEIEGEPISLRWMDPRTGAPADGGGLRTALAGVNPIDGYMKKTVIGTGSRVLVYGENHAKVPLIVVVELRGRIE